MAFCYFSEFIVLVDRDEDWEGIEVTDNITSILHLGELIRLGFTALNFVVFVLHYFTPLLHSFVLSFIFIHSPV